MPRRDIRPDAEARVAQVLADCNGDRDAALLALALLRLPPGD